MLRSPRGLSRVSFRTPAWCFLSCSFNSTNAAVFGSVDFYPGEVCSLLGHNGVGKTTVTFILVGRFSFLRITMERFVQVCWSLRPDRCWWTNWIIALTANRFDSELDSALKQVRCPSSPRLHRWLILGTLYDQLSVEEHLQLMAQVRIFSMMINLGMDLNDC